MKWICHLFWVCFSQKFQVLHNTYSLFHTGWWDLTVITSAFVALAAGVSSSALIPSNLSDNVLLIPKSCTEQNNHIIYRIKHLTYWYNSHKITVTHADVSKVLKLTTSSPSSTSLMEGVAGALRFELSSTSESWKQKVTDIAIISAWVYHTVFCWKKKKHKAETVSLFYKKKKEKVLNYGHMLWCLVSNLHVQRIWTSANSTEHPEGYISYIVNSVWYYPWNLFYNSLSIWTHLITMCCYVVYTKINSWSSKITLQENYSIKRAILSLWIKLLVEWLSSIFLRYCLIPWCTCTCTFVKHQFKLSSLCRSLY